MDWIFNPEAWIALLTLTAHEIVLGIDNIIFISILVGRLPENQRNKGRVLGLGFAMATRILLLLSITWVMQLTEPLFFIRGGWDRTKSGRVKGELDVDQLTLMGSFGRRWTDHFEFLFGLAYVDLSADLEVSGQLVNLAASRDADWIDPTVGLQYNRPMGEDWRLNLRGDIGGFGIGSDLMYQLLATFRWQASDTTGVVIGYRLIGFDYEQGQGAKYQHYDLTQQGRLVGVTFSF